jgi:hypothetical protein
MLVETTSPTLQGVHLAVAARTTSSSAAWAHCVSRRQCRHARPPHRGLSCSHVTIAGVIGRVVVRPAAMRAATSLRKSPSTKLLAFGEMPRGRGVKRSRAAGVLTQ